MVFGECRRVEYDQIVAVAYLFEILDGIGGDGLMSDGIAEVEFHVLVGELYGPLRRIDGAYLYGSSGHGPDREPSRIAESVEYVAARGVAAQQGAVLTLVEEESRLLSLLPVDLELESVFGYDVRLGVRVPEQISVDGIQAGLEWDGLRTLVIDGRKAVGECRTQGLGYGHARAVHAHRVALYDGHRPVYVDYESGQRVSLAVYQTIAVGIGCRRESERTPDVASDGYAAVPPCLIYGFAFEREDTHGDGAYLVVSARDELSRLCIYVDHFALFDLGLVGAYGGDGAGEYPRMASQQRLLFSATKKYLCSHCGGYLGLYGFGR